MQRQVLEGHPILVVEGEPLTVTEITNAFEATGASLTNADRVVRIERERELELRTHAVGAGDEHRFGILVADLEQRAEAADPGQNLRP